MLSLMFWYLPPGKLASRLFAALVCCCLLFQPGQCLPAQRDAFHRVRGAVVLKPQNSDYSIPPERSATEPELTIMQTPTNSLVPGLAYLGCFTDSQPSSLVLPSATPRYLLNGISYTSTATASLTWAACGGFCSSYHYASLSAGSICTCGNSFAFSPGLSLDSSCQMSCSGSSSQACGGSTRSTVFFNTNFGGSILPVGLSSFVSAAALPQAMTLPQPSGIASSASVVSRSSLLPLASSVTQLPTSTQLAPTVQNVVASLLDSTSLATAIALPTSVPFIAALPSTSSTRLTTEVTPTVVLSAISAQLIPIQSVIALPTPILPVLAPVTLVSTFAQGSTLPPASSQVSSSAPASLNLALSPAQSAPTLSLVVAPAVASLATMQPIAVSANLVGQLAPIIPGATSPILSTAPSAQVSTPVAPTLILVSAYSSFPTPTVLLGPPSTLLPPVLSTSNVLDLLQSSNPTPSQTLSSFSGAGLINNALLLPLTGAATSSPASILTLSVPSATITQLVGILASLPSAVSIQPSGSTVAVVPGVVGLLPTAFSVSQLLVSSRPPPVTVVSQGIPALTAAQPPVETTPLLAPILAAPLGQPSLIFSSAGLGPGSVPPGVLPVSQLLELPPLRSVTTLSKVVPPLTVTPPLPEVAASLLPLPFGSPVQPPSSLSGVGLEIGSVLSAAIPSSQTLAAFGPPIVTGPLNVDPILTTVIPPLAATSLIVASLPLAAPMSLLLAVPQLDTIPLTAAPALPTSISLLAGVPPQGIASSVLSLESEVPWWVITNFLEPHSLPSPPVFATPPPLALPALPSVEEPSLPVPSVLSPVLSSTSTNTVLGSLPAGSAVPQVIESGTFVDKVFTWSLYADGSASVNGTILSPETGPIQAYLSDGMRIGMDSAGLYIGREHRVPYPPEFLQIVRGYLLPPPQLFL